jgi:hypothetical protein
MYFGRYTVRKDCLAFDWSNSGISFNFFGSGFILSLGEFTCDEPAYIKVYLDGAEQRFAISTGKEKIIYENLPEKRHRVTILRITEGEIPLLFKDLVLFGKDQKFMAPPSTSRGKSNFTGIPSPAGTGLSPTRQRPHIIRFSRTAQ